MATLRLSENALAADLASILADVRCGEDIVVERENLPPVLLTSAFNRGRCLSDAIAGLEASPSSGVMDLDFADDVELGMREARNAWRPPSWD